MRIKEYNYSCGERRVFGGGVVGVLSGDFLQVGDFLSPKLARRIRRRLRDFV